MPKIIQQVSVKFVIVSAESDEMKLILVTSVLQVFEHKGLRKMC
jgi:hypothetical protein